MGKRNLVEVDMPRQNINEDTFLIYLRKGDADFRGLWEHNGRGNLACMRLLGDFMAAKTYVLIIAASVVLNG
jgi:hypothetical protein